MSHNKYIVSRSPQGVPIIESYPLTVDLEEIRPKDKVLFQDPATQAQVLGTVMAAKKRRRPLVNGVPQDPSTWMILIRREDQTLIYIPSKGVSLAPPPHVP